MNIIRTLISVFMLAIFSNVNAQLWNKIKKAASETIEDKTIRKTKKQTGDVFDGVFEGNKTKKKKPVGDNESNSEDKAFEESPEVYDEDEVSGTTTGDTDSSEDNFKMYQKFDFISGQKIIVFEDFSKDELGDLPGNWNSSGNCEIVTLGNDSRHWLKIGLNTTASFIPEEIDEFPDNFTLEFDMVVDFDPASSSSNGPRRLHLVFSDVANNGYFLNKKKPGKNNFIYTFAADVGVEGRGAKVQYEKTTPDRNLNLSSSKKNEKMTKTTKGKIVHISISRQKSRMKLYIDETKVYDIPRAFEKEVKLNAIRFFANIKHKESNFFISNIRYAVGKPDTRHQLVTEGKFVTNSITFAY